MRRRAEPAPPLDHRAEDDAKGEEDLGREVARGRSTRTPFVLFFGVNVALFGLALAIAAVVLVVLLVWRFA